MAWEPRNCFTEEYIEKLYGSSIEHGFYKDYPDEAPIIHCYHAENKTKRLILAILFVLFFPFSLLVWLVYKCLDTTTIR